MVKRLDAMLRNRMIVPTDPVEAAKMALALAERASAGPWHACHNGECSCKQVWTAEYPVAAVTHGEWGDEYPAIRHVEGRGMSGTTAEAYMEMMTYGSVYDHVAKANAQLIAFARTALPILAAAVLAGRQEQERSVDSTPNT